MRGDDSRVLRRKGESIPRNDFAFVAMNGLDVTEIAEPAAHQKFRAAGADRVVAAAAGGRFVIMILSQ